MLFLSLNKGNICNIFQSFTQKGLATLGFVGICNSFLINNQCRLFFAYGIGAC